MKDREKPIIVSALIVTRKNKGGQTEILNVLAYNKDRYGFPGGKLNEGETPEQAVLRETKEELGVLPTDSVYKDTFNALTPEGRPIEMHLFTGELAGDISPSGEIAEMYWLTYDQMKEKPELLTPMTIEYILPLLRTM